MKHNNPHHKPQEFYLIEIPVFFVCGLLDLAFAVVKFPFMLLGACMVVVKDSSSINNNP